MNKKINVLIFPAGEINAIELHDALATNVNINLFGGSSVERHGSYVYKQYISDIPLITDNNFFAEFNKIISKKSINVIFPTHDTVATFFAENKNKINAKVIVASKKTAEICRDKELTYKLFADFDFVPIKISDPLSAQLPFFIKPRIASGSVGAKIVHGYDEIKNLDLSEYVISEYLPGEEYTVDCLTDKNGRLCVVSPRSRDRTLAGVSVAGRTVDLTDEIQFIADTLNSRLDFEGLWFFQIKKDIKGKLKLLEVSTRAAGTMSLTRVRGANLPLLSIYVAMGYDITPIINDFDLIIDRTLINRYRLEYQYDTVYLDFDDTVVVDGAVHPYSIMFIYQCQRLKKKIHLITKHEKKILETLANYRIDPALFESIIHLNSDDHKIDNIIAKDAIFIDNAFQERKLVYDKYKIPVFDVDALEALIDWKS